jgi:hypothetical protein
MFTIESVTTRAAGDGETTVYAGDYLIGEFCEPLDMQMRNAGLFYVSVIAPTGEGWPLYECRGPEAAIAQIVAAANSYNYQPHPVALTQSGTIDGRVSHHMWCWTCRDNVTGLTQLARGADRDAVRQRGLAEHQRRGQPAKILPHILTVAGTRPIRLPGDVPPPNSPYAM